MLTQEQYNILQKNTRHLEVKVELMNEKNIVLDSIEGKASSGDLSFSSESTYRRSGSIKMINDKKDYLPKKDSKVWFNRRVRINIGLRNWNDNIVWFDQGIFNLANISATNSADSTQVDITLNDLMSNLDGTLNGNLSHEVNIKPEGIPLVDAIRSTLSQLGMVSIDDIMIGDVTATVPYELSFSPDSSVYDAVKTMIDLYMGMEMFYDKRGILIIRKIRDRENDPVIWDFSKDGMNVAIDFSNTFNFENIRNSIYLWGRKKNTGETIKWVYRNRYSRKTAPLMNSISNKTVGDICTIEDSRVSYIWDGAKWATLSFKVNPDYSIEAIGERKFAYSDEKIATIDQARLRAEYELKNRGNFMESIGITSIPIYGLEVNSKIYVEDIASGIKGDYIVKSVSIPIDVDSNMTIQAEKLYY